jgi:TonB family protein
MKSLVIPLLLSLVSYGPWQPPSKDLRPPASDLDRQERALLDAAAANPTSGVEQYAVAVFYWEVCRAPDLSPAQQRSCVLKGIAAADRALAINPDYREAMVYKNLLLRIQANVSTGQATQKRLIDEAGALHARALALQRRTTGFITTQGAPPPPSPPAGPFTGFAEPFARAMARLRPVRVRGNIQQPEMTKGVPPVPPAEAVEIRGAVILEVIVGADGRIANARVVKSIPILDAPTLSAVSQWEFTPTLLKGAPVAVVMDVTVTFPLR